MQKLFFGWDEDRVKYLHEHGKIRGYTESKKNNSQNSSKNIQQKKTNNIPLNKIQRSKEKDWLDWNLMFWANEHTLELQTEYKFHPTRDWRFDYAFAAVKIAVEYEGVFQNREMKKKGRVKHAVHSSVGGVLRDIEKYNEAQILGWKILRVTAKDYKSAPQKLNALLCI